MVSTSGFISVSAEERMAIRRERAVKAAIVRDGRVLVLWRSPAEAGAEAPRMDLPGGRLRHGESTLAALHREVAEEVGLAIEVVTDIESWSYVDGDTAVDGVTYLCRRQGGSLRLSDEHEAFRWLSDRQLAPFEFPAKVACRLALTMAEC